jgi:predicted aspartyl protease
MRRSVIAFALFASVAAPAAAAPPAHTVPTSLAGGAVLVKVDIAGTPAWMQIDTGASSSVIDSREADALGLEASGDSEKTRTIGCTASSQPVAISGWKVGGVPLPDLTISAIRGTGKVAMHHGLPIIGLLGNDALSTFGVVGVDFVDKRLVLGGDFPKTGRQLDAGALVDRAGAVQLFVAKVKIAGKAAEFAVDTGAGTSVVDTTAAKQLGLKLGKHTVKVQAVACKTKVRPVEIPQWTSGRVHLPFAIAVARRNTGLDKLGLAGLLGAPTMASFGQVTFDYSGKHIALGFPVPAGSTPAPAPVSRTTRIAAAV